MSAEVPIANAWFGRGGDEPYAHALQTVGPLLLHDIGRPAHDDAPPPHRRMSVRRFLARADSHERRLLAATRGSVLDVGCGPGRMVAEAVRAGRLALGVDVAPGPMALAVGRGLPVLHGSVFDAVPRTGEWEVVLLLDGNLGIGGDVGRILRRCAELTSATGVLVVETAPDRTLDRAFTAAVSTPGAGRSGCFPWAEIGAEALAVRSLAAGWRVEREVRRRRRTFVVLRRWAPS